MIDHRWFSRVSIAIPVELRGRNGAYSNGLALNLSSGGLFVQTSLPRLYGGALDVHMAVACRSGEYQIRLPSLIVHRTQAGVGLMFLKLDDLAQAAVTSLRQEHTPWSRRNAPGPLTNHRPPFHTQENRVSTRG